MENNKFSGQQFSSESEEKETQNIVLLPQNGKKTKNKHKNERVIITTKKITGLALLAALSVALVFLNAPIFPTAPFLRYDPADIPLFIVGFLYGPIAGLLVTTFVCLIQAFAITADGIYGFIMHLLATGSYVLVSSLIYKFRKNFKVAVFAMIAGSATWVITMIGANLIVTPIFTGAPRAVVINMLLPVIIPFNIIKVSVNSVITLLLYKPVSILYHKYLSVGVKTFTKRQKENEPSQKCVVLENDKVSEQITEDNSKD